MVATVSSVSFSSLQSTPRRKSASLASQISLSSKTAARQSTGDVTSEPSVVRASRRAWRCSARDRAAIVRSAVASAFSRASRSLPSFRNARSMRSDVENIWVSPILSARIFQRGVVVVRLGLRASMTQRRSGSPGETHTASSPTRQGHFRAITVDRPFRAASRARRRRASTSLAFRAAVRAGASRRSAASVPEAASTAAAAA